MLLEACTTGVHDIAIGTTGRTALDHAYECEAVLGPLPKFSCADAIEVPTSKNGVPVTFLEGEEGKEMKRLYLENIKNKN